MSHYNSYLKSAKEILSLYHGGEPFASFIKKYFSGHKKFGSKDRKQVSSICYSYFRIGKLAIQLPADERILTGIFLCSSAYNEVLAALKNEWNEQVGLTVSEKISFLRLNDFTNDIFPCTDEVSDGINKQEFILSHLKQPDLFLRLRPGKEKEAIEKLQKSSIDFKILSENCLAFNNASKVEEIIKLNKEAIVQDYSSQQVKNLLLHVISGSTNKVWDCCAGSGGKSIMAHDLNPAIDLVVSDIRESILINLEKRFKAAGIKKYKSFAVDLVYSPLTIHDSSFDLIIADVPCSGSGTWGRTPEQLTYFNTNKIDEYAALQKKIVSNVISCLQPGAHLLYITCSVFKKENEAVVEFIKEQFHLQLVKMELLRGYQMKADTMFVALLQKPL